jgi:periplasmic protein TonB
VILGYYHSPVLPWTVSEEDEQRFRRILKRTLVLLLIFAVVIPFLPLPKIEREEIEEIPPRFAKLLLEQQQPPETPAIAKIPDAPKPKTKPKPKKKVEKKVVKPDTATARKQAERAGLMAFRDDLAALRDNPVVAGIQKNAPLVQGKRESTVRSERSIITSNATSGSGGINTARLSRDTGGGGLTGRATTQVDSPVGGGEAGGNMRRGGGQKASRSIEEIQVVFDRNKSAIYALYNRALRRDPTLQGKVVLKLTIAPSGAVTACLVVSSDLRAPDLERKLATRVKLFDFGAKDVNTMVVTYPIEFLPS